MHQVSNGDKDRFLRSDDSVFLGRPGYDLHKEAGVVAKKHLISFGMTHVTYLWWDPYGKDALHRECVIVELVAQTKLCVT